MAFETSWLAEKRIVRSRNYGQVTVEELQATADTIYNYIHEGVAPVHAILDFTNVEKFPTRISAFKNFVFPAMQPNTGMLVLVSANKLALFAISVVAQMSKRPLITFSTLDEALAFLEHTDATLPPLAVYEMH